MRVNIPLWENLVEGEIPMGPAPPPAFVIRNVAAPINLAPGYVLSTTQPYAAVNGSPAFELEFIDGDVILDDEGYYEIDVADVDGVATRHPICIVNSTRLTAAIESPAAAQTPAFKRLAANLAEAYPHGKVAPLVQDRSQQLDAHVDRAVLLEVRARTPGSTYSPITAVLAKAAGTWRSGAFNLPQGRSDLRLAVAISPSDTVLS